MHIVNAVTTCEEVASPDVSAGRRMEVFRRNVRERFGCEPEIRYFDVMMVLDNLSGEVVEDLGRPVPLQR